MPARSSSPPALPPRRRVRRRRSSTSRPSRAPRYRPSRFPTSRFRRSARIARATWKARTGCAWRWAADGSDAARSLRRSTLECSLRSHHSFASFRLRRMAASETLVNSRYNLPGAPAGPSLPYSFAASRRPESPDMRFPPSFLEEIRARLPASLVIGKRVKLKKQGREFAGLSPFNQERTPSFFVNDQKGAWFDFSAGKNGNIFSFLMEAEGLSFHEAVERLAAEAGVPMPDPDPEAEKREAARASLYEVLELATKFFEESLQSRAGAAARGYLQNRGLGPELQRRFRIGYARADRNALKEHLAGKDIAQDQIIAAGLLISGDDVPVSYDRFRERVIFPISDFKGRIVGFGGRALAADVPAKYLNSPETDLFHKGTLLYNGAEA